MIKTLPISKLKTNNGQIQGLPKNPRFIRDERFEKLKKSIKDLPSMLELRELIVVPQNGHYVTIGGNMRLRAAKDLGLTELPCKVLDADTPPEVLAEISVKDNVAFGDNDYDILANEWTDFPLTDWGMELPDFEGVTEEPSDAEPQIDKAAELNNKWKVKSGDLWQIGEHRLLCGDSTKREDVERLMADGKAVMMLSDPPYNVKYDYDTISDNKSDAEYAAFCDAYLSLGASVSQMQVVTPGKANERLYDYAEYMTWFKGFGLSRGSFYKAMVTEPILLFGDKPTNKFYSTDHFHFGTDREEGLRDLHTCPKPKELFQALIEPMTDKGDAVYEAFGGSGTTLVACQNLNRKCYAIEISENYCAVILERMQTAFPDLDIRREGD